MWLISLARNAVVVIMGIVLVSVLSLYGLKPFKITGNITKGLPPFRPPPFTINTKNKTYHFHELIQELGGTIASIPLIAILESVAIAKAFGMFNRI